MSESVAIVVRLPARPETSARMCELLLRVVETMALEPDFINTWIHEDINNPNTVILYETWACGREYFLEHHLKKEYRREYEAELPTLLAAQRNSIIFANR
jgi:quinol monooxygenase YgiN